MNRFSGQTAIVTGAARGIGRAIAERLASEGATLALADINGAGVRAAADEIGSGSFAIIADIAEPNNTGQTGTTGIAGSLMPNPTSSGPM